VSGPKGFLGHYLVARLIQEHHSVVTISRTSIEEHSLLGGSVHLASTEGLKLLSDAVGTLDAVVHCATQYRRQHVEFEIESLVKSNVLLGIQLAEVAALQTARFVNISTFFQHEGGKPHNPISLYASLKDAMSDITDFYVQRRGLNAVDLFLYNNFGPGDLRDKVVPLIVRACESGGSLSLKSPNALINLLYVKDVVSAIHLAIESDVQGRYSVANDNTVSIGALLSLVEDVFGRAVAVKWTEPDGVPEPPIPPLYPRFPGWRPTWTLEQGLRELRNSLL
jgi:nucleoside-diphosphate-sugar epimerase